MATIAQILMAQGQEQAESRRRRAGAWMPLVQHLATLPNQVMADRAAEGMAREAGFDRAQQRAVRGQQLAKGAQDLETGKREMAASEATAEQKRQMNDVLQSPGVLDPTNQRMDARKAQEVAAAKGYTEILDDILTLAPEHNAAIDKGMREQTLFDQGQTDRRQATNQQGVRRMIGESIAGRGGGPISPADRQTYQGMALQEGVTLPAGVLPEPEEEVSMVVKGPNGRPTRVLVPKSQLRGGQGVEEYREPQMSPQERSGYFTMTPIYDAQGRPIGAMKLNARTGETTLVKPEDMGGGVTARPPGNLGQRTVENEAALDSLGRLKDMYDKGAKDDIGPAEGRARSIGQQVPGGAFVTERFANFEAATRAFQNAMIKAITGAQMSEPEAKRIMGQIPNVNDNPTVWQAKYAQSVKNMEDLENRTRTDRGAPKADPTDALLDELLGGGR